jgi:hypothetical protein
LIHRYEVFRAAAVSAGERAPWYMVGWKLTNERPRWRRAVPRRVYLVSVPKRAYCRVGWCRGKHRSVPKRAYLVVRRTYCRVGLSTGRVARGKGSNGFLGACMGPGWVGGRGGGGWGQGHMGLCDGRVVVVGWGGGERGGAANLQPVGCINCES